MSLITLKYAYPDLPVLLNRDAEGGTHDWNDGGNHSVTISTDYAHGGTNSFKLVASGSGDFTTNNINLDSGNNTDFTVGEQYVITMWLYQHTYSVFTNFQIKTGGATSQQYNVSGADAWTLISFLFTAATASTKFQIALASAATIYFDDIVVAKAVKLTPLAVRGIDDPDMVELWPPIQNRFLDGSIGEQMSTFRRKILIDLGPVSSRTDRLRILYWLMDSTRSLDWGAESDVFTALQDPTEFSNTWLMDSLTGRAFTLNLLETTVRTVFPV